MGFGVSSVYLERAINSGPSVAWGPYLAIAAVLNSALSLGYYAWIIRKMYMEEGPDMSKIKEPRAMVAVPYLRLYLWSVSAFGTPHC